MITLLRRRLIVISLRVRVLGRWVVTASSTISGPRFRLRRERGIAATCASCAGERRLATSHLRQKVYETVNIRRSTRHFVLEFPIRIKHQQCGNSAQAKLMHQSLSTGSVGTEVHTDKSRVCPLTNFFVAHQLLELSARWAPWRGNLDKHKAIAAFGFRCGCSNIGAPVYVGSIRSQKSNLEKDGQ